MSLYRYTTESSRRYNGITLFRYTAISAPPPLGRAGGGIT